MSNKTNMESIPSVAEIIELVKIDICDNYCKWPERYGINNRDLNDPDRDEKYDHMIDEVCEKCPLDRL